MTAGDPAGGQWTSGGGAASGGANGGANEAHLESGRSVGIDATRPNIARPPISGVVLAGDIVTPKGYTLQHLAGQDPLDPQGLNAPITAAEQQKIANALTLLLNGAGSALQPHPYRNLPHNITGAVLPASAAGYVAYDVPGLGARRGVGRLLIENGTGAIYYTNNHYYSFYAIHLHPNAE